MKLKILQIIKHFSQMPVAKGFLMLMKASVSIEIS